MPRKGPHISIAGDKLVPRVLRIPEAELARWPEGVRELAVELAAELFLVRYNPYINPALVKKSVEERLSRSRIGLAPEYQRRMEKAAAAYWADVEDDARFKAEVVRRLAEFLPAEAIVQDEKSLIETATDATDLRIELPMLLAAPTTIPQVQGIVRLAGEMEFALIPRGGGTGATGGAVPARLRTVMLSMSRFKTIYPVDLRSKVLCAQAGVITQSAIKAAEAAGLLFTVDPASKAGSSIGGNISENSGGPFAFEYGTTLDNILSFKQVMPDGRLVEVRRRDHPRRKILEADTAVFDIFGEDGRLVETISLRGDEIRGAGLGKDVSNKFLGGLPGVQKEGVDGVIVEGCFTLYDRPKLSRSLCLEFYGRSMHNAVLVIKDVVALRDAIREAGDLVKISALEEFNSKYVQAIGYEKKSERYEGEPISVLLLQLDGDDAAALDEAVVTIADIARVYQNVDAFVARDAREAEHFWEDRHKLSAISKRTSGFKINEDIVLPIEQVPEFSDFLEDLNLRYTSQAYRTAIQEAGRLPGLSVEDKSLDGEIITAMKVLRGAITAKEMSDAEMEVRAALFFQDLESRYPRLKEELAGIFHHMLATRIVIASHMHAGDGNCHVNIPVNSNDPVMLASAHEAAEKVFAKVLSLGGEVSGEHGIGITKINFLQEEKIEALRAYKARVDPKGIINPDKLTTRATRHEPYTFSFNRLIRDLQGTGLPDKERLIKILTDVQVCTRCGKCKQVCPMYDPTRGLSHYPRNKNIALGALVEAIYYTQLMLGRPEEALLKKLREMTEHCTACGKCAAVCSVKINTADVTLFMRAFLEDKLSGGHPIKSRVLDYLAQDPALRVPITAKMLSVGQDLANAAVGFVPLKWRRRLKSPALADKGPRVGFRNLDDALGLTKGAVFAPEALTVGREAPEAVFYFPGCGAGLFSRPIGLAALALLLRSGVAVVLPDKHLCCGYPLLASGLEEAYLANQDRNLPVLRSGMAKARELGLKAATVLTSCGTCRESLQKYSMEMIFGLGVGHQDVTQYLLPRLPRPASGGGRLLYHAACHAEWSGFTAAKASEAARRSIGEFLSAEVALSPGCCGESGLGALTSPAIYNRIRERKRIQLTQDLDGYAGPILVGCPSCKVGIGRTLMTPTREAVSLLADGAAKAAPTLAASADGAPREVLHILEYLARTIIGPQWEKELLARIAAAPSSGGLRVVKG